MHECCSAGEDIEPETTPPLIKESAFAEDMLIKTTTAQAPWTIVPGNDKYFARVEVLKTVVDRLSKELHVDATPEALADLPPLAAATPIPEWAYAEAKEFGVKIG